MVIQTANKGIESEILAMEVRGKELQIEFEFELEVVLVFEETASGTCVPPTNPLPTCDGKTAYLTWSAERFLAV